MQSSASQGWPRRISVLFALCYVLLAICLHLLRPHASRLSPVARRPAEFDSQMTLSVVNMTSASLRQLTVNVTAFCVSPIAVSAENKPTDILNCICGRSARPRRRVYSLYRVKSMEQRTLGVTV